MRDFLEQYVPRLYGFALRLTHDTHLAEDLTQETFLRAWSRRKKLRQPEAARVWLFRITVNLWRDHVRRGRVRGAWPMPLPATEASRDSSPDLQAADQDDLRRVMEALDGLPERQREVLHLSVWEGLTSTEIGDVLGISADAAKASLSLARKRLRQQLPNIWENLSSAK